MNVAPSEGGAFCCAKHYVILLRWYNMRALVNTFMTGPSLCCTHKAVKIFAGWPY